MFATAIVRGKCYACVKHGYVCVKHLEKRIERKTCLLMCQVMEFKVFGIGVLSVKSHDTKSGCSSGCIRGVLNLGRRIIINEQQKLTRGFIVK